MHTHLHGKTPPPTLPPQASLARICAVANSHGLTTTKPETKQGRIFASTRFLSTGVTKGASDGISSSGKSSFALRRDNCAVKGNSKKGSNGRTRSQSTSAQARRNLLGNSQIRLSPDTLGRNLIPVPALGPRSEPAPWDRMPGPSVTDIPTIPTHGCRPASPVSCAHPSDHVLGRSRNPHHAQFPPASPGPPAGASPPTLRWGGHSQTLPHLEARGSPYLEEGIGTEVPAGPRERQGSTDVCGPEANITPQLRRHTVTKQPSTRA